MKRKNEKVPGFDEIVFQNRNKEYGAYDIRRKYLPTGIWSAIGGTVLFAAAVIGSFIAAEKKGTAIGTGGIIVVLKTDPDINDPNKVKVDVVEPVKPKIETFKYVPPTVVDKLDSSKQLMATSTLLDTYKDKPVDTSLVIRHEPDPIFKPEPEVLVYVPEMPEFPGGNDKITSYLNDNLKYPQSAVDNSIEGKVILRFVVWMDGSIRRIEILRSVDPVLDQEAIRVVSRMPKWKPGKNNGTPAPVWFSLPVTFRLRRN